MDKNILQDIYNESRKALPIFMPEWEWINDFEDKITEIARRRGFDRKQANEAAVAATQMYLLEKDAALDEQIKIGKVII